jgi:hypothetical protein
MTEQYYALSESDLDRVSGGDRDVLADWKGCDYGTKAGGSPGLYPWYADCLTPTKVSAAILDAINRVAGTHAEK